MKTYIMTDMEGVAGVNSFESQSYPEGRYYDQGKKLVTAEVNAAVQALVDLGSEDILVADGHGPGAIVFEELHPAAKLFHGRPIASGRLFGEIGQDYDICMMVGQHAMAGVQRGNQNHTGSSRTVDYVKINGRPVGEMAEFALVMGVYDVPMIFLSGDEAACQEAQDFIPGIVTAAVKQGLGRSCAISMSAQGARQLISDQVKHAVTQHQQSPIAPLKWDGPYTIEKRFFHTDTADAAVAGGWQRIDSQTVSKSADDIRDLVWC